MLFLFFSYTKMYTHVLPHLPTVHIFYSWETCQNPSQVQEHSEQVTSQSHEYFLALVCYSSCSSLRLSLSRCTVVEVGEREQSDTQDEIQGGQDP